MTAIRRFALQKAFPIFRALLLLLVLPIASLGSLPAWATLVGGEAPHVCHCAREHHDCVCAQCHTDPEAGTRPSTESIRGQCGDDAPTAFGTKAFLAIADAPLNGLVAVDLRHEASVVVEEASTSRDRTRPTTPPPRHVA